MTSFATALSLLQSVRSAARELDNAPIAQGLLDLQGQLLCLQIQALERDVETRLLQQEEMRLRTCLSTERKLERASDAYYMTDRDGARRGPYCMKCWDRRDLLQQLLDADEGVGYCPNCQTRARIGLD